MNKTNNLDLNLLKILVVILEEKSFTRAGEKVGLSQSAISHAMKRLREHFNDALTIRKGNKVELTAKAEQLRVPVKRWLSELEAVLDPSTFEPFTSTKRFNIACMDVFEQMLAPKIVKELRKVAPLISIYFTKLDHRRFYEQLSTGETDFAIGVYNYGGHTDIQFTTLYEELFASAAKTTHPIHKAKEKLKAYASYPHIIAGIGGGGKSNIDLRLEALGLSRTIKLQVSNFSSAPFFLEGSDLILTAPKRFLGLCAKRHPVKVFPTPVEQDPFPVNLYWSQKYHDHEASKWLRSIIQRIAKSI